MSAERCMGIHHIWLCRGWQIRRYVYLLYNQYTLAICRRCQLAENIWWRSIQIVFCECFLRKLKCFIKRTVVIQLPYWNKMSATNYSYPVNILEKRNDHLWIITIPFKVYLNKATTNCTKIGKRETEHWKCYFTFCR